MKVGRREGAVEVFDFGHAVEDVRADVAALVAVAVEINGRVRLAGLQQIRVDGEALGAVGLRRV